MFVKARDGPALSCNFCWNTTDGSGRILRRKTKYHCPECQTNLCIGKRRALPNSREKYQIFIVVPCFQQYHEAMENENTEMRQNFLVAESDVMKNIKEEIFMLKICVVLLFEYENISTYFVLYLKSNKKAISQEVARTY